MKIYPKDGAQCVSGDVKFFLWY